MIESPCVELDGAYSNNALEMKGSCSPAALAVAAMAGNSNGSRDSSCAYSEISIEMSERRFCSAGAVQSNDSSTQSLRMRGGSNRRLHLHCSDAIQLDDGAL
jgi:hypothetical protein